MKKEAVGDKRVFNLITHKDFNQFMKSAATKAGMNQTAFVMRAVKELAERLQEKPTYMWMVTYMKDTSTKCIKVYSNKETADKVASFTNGVVEYCDVNKMPDGFGEYRTKACTPRLGE